MKNCLAFLLFTTCVALMAGCAGSAPAQAATDSASPPTAPAPTQPATPPPPLLSTSAPTPSPTLSPSPNPSPSPTVTPVGEGVTAGPDSFLPGTNPLTGLPAADPASLDIPPALISISNFPVTTRPQSGLSFASFVYEFYMGFGMTRFLAIFYGDLPWEAARTANLPVRLAIGPIRSGRRPYEPMRQIYEGFVLIAGASQRVLPFLREYTPVYGRDSDDINSAMIEQPEFEKLAAEAKKELKKPSLIGLKFDSTPPPGGQPARTLWVGWNKLDQVYWRYDPARRAYLRWQDNMDGQTFIQATDKLTGRELAFANVVVMFANYHFYDEALFEIDLMYRLREKALILRDGRIYEAFWTTAGGDYEKKTGRLRPVRFVDRNGQAFPLRPGQTFVELATPGSSVHETVDSFYWDEVLKIRKPGSGSWAVQWQMPAYETQP